MQVVEGKVDDYDRCPDCMAMRAIKIVDGVRFMLACEECDCGLIRLQETGIIVDDDGEIIARVPGRPFIKMTFKSE